MKRWELFHAIDGMDAKIDNTIRSNEETLTLLDRVFDMEQSDLSLGAGYVDGDFSSIAEICIKEVLDERRCGRLRQYTLQYLIPLAIKFEYEERGQQNLPNGDPLVGKNITKLLLEEN